MNSTSSSRHAVAIRLRAIVYASWMKDILEWEAPFVLTPLESVQ